jgi:hypothetical protein
MTEVQYLFMIAVKPMLAVGDQPAVHLLCLPIATPQARQACEDPPGKHGVRMQIAQDAPLIL